LSNGFVCSVKIYTKTGDKGETSLFGGRRVPKDDLRIETCGAVDELNSVIGIARSIKMSRALDTILQGVQNDLFILGADLAAPVSSNRRSSMVPRIDRGHVAATEALIDKVQPELPSLKRFILPGGSLASAHLHHARAVCRRTERRAVTLARKGSVNPLVISYLNRLSDLLFILARFASQNAGVRDVRWLAPDARGQRRRLRN
jgi:cob(I)alamin adenosyltransferase